MRLGNVVFTFHHHEIPQRNNICSVTARPFLRSTKKFLSQIMQSWNQPWFRRTVLTHFEEKGWLELKVVFKMCQNCSSKSRVAQGVASNNFSFLSALQTSQCFISRWTHSWRMNQLFYNIFNPKENSSLEGFARWRHNNETCWPSSISEEVPI